MSHRALESELSVSASWFSRMLEMLTSDSYNIGRWLALPHKIAGLAHHCVFGS